LQALKANSGAVVYRIQDSSVDYLAGQKIGGVKIEPGAVSSQMLDVVRLFYKTYFLLFVSTEIKSGDLQIQKQKVNGTTVLKVQQYADGIRILDKQWTIVFDRDGYISRVTSRPADPRSLSVNRTPAINQSAAIAQILQADKALSGNGAVQSTDRFSFELCLL